MRMKLHSNHDPFLEDLSVVGIGSIVHEPYIESKTRVRVKVLEDPSVVCIGTNGIKSTKWSTDASSILAGLP